MPFQESPAPTRVSKPVKMRTLHHTSIWIWKTGKPVFLGNWFCLWPTVYILVTIGTQWVPMDSLTSHHLSQEFLCCLVSSCPSWTPFSSSKPFSGSLLGPATLSTPTHKHLPPELLGTRFLKCTSPQPWIRLICSSEGKICLCSLGFSSTQHRLDFTEKGCSS